MNWLRRAAKRLARWASEKDGLPEAMPPGSIARIAVGFPEHYPEATVGQWVGFAVRHAGSAWLDGYRAGWEARGGVAQQEPEVVPELASPLANADLNRVVQVQGPWQYEDVTFVDERRMRDV